MSVWRPSHAEYQIPSYKKDALVNVVFEINYSSITQISMEFADQ